MKDIKLWILCSGLLMLMLISGCRDEEVTPEEEQVETTPLTLVEATRIFSRPAGDLRAFISLSGLDVDVDLMVHDVTLYKITYKTDYKGDSITASAVIMLPNTDDTVSTVSFQHGTIASEAEAPTNLELSDGQIIFTSALASTGLVVVLPDFIGFGASGDLMHPYYVEDLTATSVLNAIYASRQLVGDLEMSIDNELYLAGYSQGGYATMATHKYFEESGMAFYDLKASFPSSGGYDIKAFQEYFFSLDTYHQPFFLAYVAYAYKETFDWDHDLDLFFNAPFAESIPGYFDGSKSGSEINALLNDELSVLLNPQFIAGVDMPAYAFVKEAFLENSLTDWTPSIPMFMYHGDADITVPYQNSVDVYARLLANGASADVVSFTTLSGGTHGTGVGPYIELFVSEIFRLEND
ncbi:MAG: lipase family protein [Marinoscillum sp.]|uniref:alpha/beta hydrolase family protein n=1 Tax=Marinoscillum sp. TaxID=2024838 RepID=UPI0032FFAC3C